MTARRGRVWSAFSKPAGLTERFIISAVALGAFLRICNFWIPALWLDEYGTWWTIAGHSWRELARRAVSVSGQSPLYYGVVNVTTDLLGVSAFSLRLPSVIAGITVVGLAYPLAARLFKDRHAGLLAVAVFAVDERLIWYAQDARPYGLALCCAMLSFLSYLSLRRADRPPARIGYWASTAAAYYAHYLFGVIILVQMLHVWLTRKWSGQRSSVSWSRIFGVMALLCLPGMSQIASLIGRRAMLEYLRPADVPQLFKLAVSFLNPQVLSAATVAVFATGVARRNINTTPREELVLLFLWIFLPLLFVGAIPPLLGVSLLSARYVLCAAPAGLLMSVWVLRSANRAGVRRWIPLAVFIVLSLSWNLLPDVRNTGVFSDRFNQDFRQAARLFAASARESDAVLFSPGFVEADSLSQPDADPLVVAFLAWPLAAHLSPIQASHVMLLPYRSTDRTRRYLDRLLGAAAQRRRVWVMGMNPVVPGAARDLEDRWRFQERARWTLGDVKVLLLEAPRKDS